MTAAPAAATKPVKNPWVAAGLSFFFPGLGQVYNGQIAKAFVFFGAFVSCIYAVIQIDPLPFAFGIPFSYLFGIVDAFRSAALAGMRPGAQEEIEAESPAWGITLIALGLVLLLNNLGWLSLAALARYWPLLLIAAGAIFIRSSIRRSAGAKGDGLSL
jgi:TM2 domain-containing membrane protein YozV